MEEQKKRLILLCEKCHKSFGAEHNRKEPHCAKCAEQLRSEGLGPIQQKRAQLRK